MIYRTFDCDFTSHLLNYRFANTESKPPSGWVYLLMFFKIAEISKQLLQLVLLHSDSEVLNAQHELHVGCFLVTVRTVYREGLLLRVLRRILGLYESLFLIKVSLHEVVDLDEL